MLIGWFFRVDKLVQVFTNHWPFFESERDWEEQQDCQGNWEYIIILHVGEKALYIVPTICYERKHEIIQDMANKRIKLFHDSIPADELKSHAMIAVQIITGEGSNHKTNNYDLFSQLLNKFKVLWRKWSS